MIERIDDGSGPVMGYRVSGKLTEEEYRAWVPEAERTVERHGRVRLLVLMEDFHGWDAASAWEEFQFGRRHNADFVRIAVVGEKAWQRILAGLAGPFVLAKVKYFRNDSLAEAWQWLREDS